jgi:FtsZ-binding cell division protein ZapB
MSGLKDKMREREALLPTPYVASEGEIHYEIAMKFLTIERGINKARALRLVERTALFDEPLIAGFRVWSFYSGDEFATFVTQGSAEISPNRLRKIAKQYLLDAMDRAIAEKEELAAEINELKSTKNQLVSQVNDLRYENQKLTAKLEELSQINIKMQSELNSLFYMVDLEKKLIEKGIIKILGLGSPMLGKISPQYFNQNIDLRKRRIIEIKASQFNLIKIKRVTLHPRFYKRDIDYMIEILEDEQKVIVTILAIDKFKSERVVISVK